VRSIAATSGGTTCAWAETATARHAPQQQVAAIVALELVFLHDRNELTVGDICLRRALIAAGAGTEIEKLQGEGASGGRAGRTRRASARMSTRRSGTIAKRRSIDRAVKRGASFEKRSHCRRELARDRIAQHTNHVRAEGAVATGKG
jgi:hypothetical protein